MLQLLLTHGLRHLQTVYYFVLCQIVKVDWLPFVVGDESLIKSCIFREKFLLRVLDHQDLDVGCRDL